MYKLTHHTDNQILKTSSSKNWQLCIVGKIQLNIRAPFLEINDFNFFFYY